TAFECVVENPRVPFIEGVTLAEAKDHIIAGGLMVGTVTEVYDETFPTGTVLDANPEPGTPVEPGSPVGLLVSKGPRPLVDLVVTKVGPIQARPGDEVSYTIAVMNR